MTQLIDGKAIAERVKSWVKEQVDELPSKPRLAVIQLGDNPASAIYVKNKLNACRKVGIETISAQLDLATSEDSLIELIHGFNDSPAFNGILVQLPLPEGINVRRVIETVIPEKDVDGFHPLNIGRLGVMSHDPYLHPCTPWGIVRMLDTVYPKKAGVSGLSGKRVVVIGQSHIVGRPVSIMLQNEGATVVMCDVNTPDLMHEVKNADVIVSGTGVPNLISEEMIEAVNNPDVTIIDAGISKVDGQIVGDASRDIYEKVGAISPVPGGVGPVTIAFLIRNVFKAYCMQNGIKMKHLSS
ncbi:MAG: bifunctional 5,10-methylenetetrahydrofolate dehydrogenase/5,10-methenyltetrahydrofolate cyclohydrolase [Methylococcales bacterium]|jgi:methylenetetrahydrofolate dehydrogenase (NADP+) / methenyltetrahydrofolate cyclohydrolase|nr:bifunctional 5,10-methylenetetrahydrofolate dehydrogenase/5,10-methenyltetrahydrofolate cyclohydrolase [Methylococcales bacterium]